jgi:penicillin-binding protein 2
VATTDPNLASRSGSLVESHKGYQPRVVFFYFAIALLLLVLVAGLAYQQVFKAEAHRGTERMQNERRILMPGPRGDIFDREGRLLVGNRSRFSVVLYLGELREEIYREYLKIRNAYRDTGDKELPTDDQLRQIARVATVQRYLDQVNVILKRGDQVDREDLKRHFLNQLLPYVLIDDLEPDQYARLIESLPVTSPLQVSVTSTRYYPYHSAAAHALGYIGVSDDLAAEGFPGEDLTTFKMKGTVGRAGLEAQFDSLVQGEAGGTIVRVSPSGYKVNEAIMSRKPVHGRSLTTSLDIDLQLAAEQALGNDRTGSVVALDVKTGEVLALASKPDYDLSAVSPRMSTATSDDIQERQAWTNRAIQGLYPPGSTFKILVSIAALRSSSITPDELGPDCEGHMRIVNREFGCDNGNGRHGVLSLSEAIAQSCDIYFYALGIRTTADVLAIEARRFHLDQRTGIELPYESGRMIIPDQDWKLRVDGEKWFPGDTANMAIGQGFLRVTPLEMACFAASVARDEIYTKPTMLHRADAPVQQSERIGLTPIQRAAILEGMEGCTTHGTGNWITKMPALRVPARVAGKTGTAQISGNKDVAWFICFAPLEKPEIAIAVALEGDTPGENYGGGQNAAPIAAAVLQKYFEKKNRPPIAKIQASQ